LGCGGYFSTNTGELQNIMKNQFFWIAAAVSLVADQLTKYWVRHTLVLDQSVPLIPGVFHFTHVINHGAAFSLFQGEGWLRWLSLAVSLFLVSVAIFGPKFERLEQISYGMVLAGALGNGIERFVLGYVTDFIDLRLIRFAIFNWADVSINLGILAYLAYVVSSTRRSR
jgi:signal peptidase II